jgi:hypothetical protein
VVALNAYYDVYDDNEPIKIGTPADVDVLLARMASDQAAGPGPLPRLTELSALGKDWVVVHVGVDGDRGLITYADPTGAFITTNGGDPAGDPLVYDYQGNVREFPADAEVPLEELRRAVHEFVTTGGRSAAVDWRTDA